MIKINEKLLNIHLTAVCDEASNDEYYNNWQYLKLAMLINDTLFRSDHCNKSFTRK